MTIKKQLITAASALPFILLAGCSDDEQVASTTETATPTQQLDPHAGMNIKLENNQGRVLSHQNAGGYTYAQVEQNGSTFWLAGKQIVIKPGDIVRWEQASIMKNYTSKALNQTFEEIYFVSNLGTNEAKTHLSPSQAAMPQSNTPSQLGTVISAQNAAGYTYIEVSTTSGNHWLAAPTTQVEVGQTIGWTGSALMKDFTSNALNRTFAEILFVPKLVTPVNPSAAPLPAAAQNQGKVIDAMNAGGYSYLQVNTPTGDKWLAAPIGDFKTGDTVSWSDAALMTNFTSNSLGKTFDEILFAGSVNKVN
jgi:hypothetical protein